jgi:hypothetical protein
MGVVESQPIAPILLGLATASTSPAHPSYPPGLVYAIIFVIVCSTVLTALALFLIRRWVFGYPLRRKSKPLIDAWALAGKRLKVDDDPDDQQYPPTDHLSQ